MTAFVYIVQADNDEVKIGASGSPWARLSKIRRDYGARRGFDDAYIVAMVETPAPMLLEHLTISLIEEHAVGGEWLAISSLYALRAFIAVGDGARGRPIVMQGPPEEHVSVRMVRDWFLETLSHCPRRQPSEQLTDAEPTRVTQ